MAYPSAEPKPLSHLGRSKPGSNGWGIGQERSAQGRGMLLANSHFPWQGELKLWQSHLRVPGEFDVYGVGLLGVVGVLIGFNEDVARTHTVSAGHRFTFYKLSLDPTDETKYLYDGEYRAMEGRPFTVDVLQPDGSITQTLTDGLVTRLRRSSGAASRPPPHRRTRPQTRGGSPADR